MRVKVLGTGCSKCRSTIDIIERAAQAVGVEVQIVKVETPEEIKRYGVRATPDDRYSKIILVTLPEVTRCRKRLRCRRTFAAPASSPMPACSTRACWPLVRAIPCWQRGWPANTSRWTVSPVWPNTYSRLPGFETAVILRRRIELLMALPISSLDTLVIQREIDDIGKR